MDKMGFSFADRVRNLGTETSFEVFAMAKELERNGAKIVHFEIGEPDFDTPQHIKDAAYKALKAGFTHYTPAPGIFELREAIAEKVSEDFEVDVDPVREVVVMPGAKTCIFTAILATVNAGDEVIISNPAYPIYESVVRLVDGVPVFVPLREENDFRLVPEDVERKVTPRTKMVILNSPHNPCGSTLLKKDVAGLAEIAKENNLWVMSDEIYSKIQYEGNFHGIVSEPDMKNRTILVDGFSKAYAMTGWRLGYATGNPEVIAHMVRLQINICSCATSFVQMAAIEALKGSQDCVKQMVREYDKRRKAMVSSLNSIKGFSCKMPSGTFYVFPNIKKLGLKSEELMKFLLNKAGVATLHGDCFGKYGEGYLRLSYATNLENIREGLNRIKEAIEGLS
jgi:aspartate/methionine/tyrosine aminotransferase